MELFPDKKIAGVLAPLFALRRDDDLGIGDTEALRQLIDWIAETGFKLVQLLPINEIGGDNSPYNAISAMAIEPTTLRLAPGSPEDLRPNDYDECLTKFDLVTLRHGSIKYPQTKQLKRQLLERAFAQFCVHAGAERENRFRNFCEKEASWLNDYALFRASMEENGEREVWDKWPTQSVEAARGLLRGLPLDRQSAFARRENFFRYVQWIAQEQWRDVKAFAERRGVLLMADIPFGVSYYSADVFTRRDQFELDWSGGAPPEPYFKDDKFTQKWGQNWGIPLYRWDVMRAHHFDWWRQRVRNVRHIFHLFRIDHVLGFYRIYAFPWRPSQNRTFLPFQWDEMLARTGGRFPHFVPRDDSTPEQCQANCREGEGYLRVILEESGKARLVGEDLGTVPDYVRPNLRSLGIAGFKIPQWEVHQGRVTPGTEYERISVATYATHDHKPLRKLWEEAVERPTSTSEQSRDALNRIAEFAGFQPQGGLIDYHRDFYPRIMEALFRSESWIASVMITDLLARKYRFNVPGTAVSGNWTRRMQRSIAQLRSSRAEGKRMALIRDLLKRTGRS